MSSKQRRTVEYLATKVELIDGLQRALDQRYRRFIQTARADWERLFAGKDPTDACASVRVSPDQPQLRPNWTRGSAFLKSRRGSRSENNSRSAMPRFAH